MLDQETTETGKLHLPNRADWCHSWLPTVVSACMISHVFGGQPAGVEGYCSPVALSKATWEDNLFVADAGRQAILSVNLSSAKVTAQFHLRETPSGIVRMNIQPWLLVTLAVPRGQVVCLDAQNGKVLSSFPVGHTPCAPALSKDDKTLYVCNRFDNQVAAYDLGSQREKWKTPVPREPVAAALTPDGSKLVVANLLPAGAATDRPFAATVSVIETANGRLRANIQLTNGATGLLGVTVSPDGRYAYVTHTVGRYQSPTKQVDFGWMNVNAFTLIDLSSNTTVATVLLDDVELGAANPWGIACSEDGHFLVVAHAGSQELSILDRRALHAKLDRLAEAVSESSTTLALVQNDLEFLKGIRRRVPLPGYGPRPVIVVGSKAIVGEYFAGKLALVDLATDSPVTEIALAPAREPDQVRRGEILFSSAQMCRQNWQSCASCHPDARVDGFNWDLLNDGTGNPKNVKSLLNAHRTPPAMWTGIRDDAKAAVRAGFRSIQFAEISEDDANAVDAFLESLASVPSPVSLTPSLKDSVTKGRIAFDEVGCARCHSGEFFTDGKAHEMGTGRGIDAGKAFVTPSLVECWRTAPYMHDGRAATIQDVIKTHGQADRLPSADRRNLVNYLLSL